MKVGIVLPSREWIMAGRHDPAALLDLAARAEDAGFDSVWAGDSLFHRPRFEPLTLLSAVAARTRRVAVGSGVLLPTLRHPLPLAHAVATLDRVAGGRLILGVGAGWIREEFDAVGVPFEERARRLAEFVRLCRGAWGADAPDRAPGAAILPTPARAGGPPIWMGGFGPLAVRNAGRLCDGWFPTSPSPEAFRTGWEAVRVAAEEAGRDPGAIEAAVYLTVNLDPGGAEETSRYTEDYYGIPHDVMARFQSFFVGDAEACAEHLAGFVEAGVRHLAVRFSTLDPLPHLERLAEHVLPRIRAQASERRHA